MHKIILSIIVILSSIILVSCQGTREEELKKLDKLWGYCDNPHREFGDLEYNTCKAKERAKTPSGKNKDMEDFNLTEFLDKVREGDFGTSGQIRTNVNPYLWQGSIDVTSVYDLKIADATGGFIQTEWIYDENTADKRCLIKIQVISADYISTGVKTNLLCENKNQDIWKSDGKEYFDEQKMLTLKILEASLKYSQSALN